MRPRPRTTPSLSTLLVLLSLSTSTPAWAQPKRAEAPARRDARELAVQEMADALRKELKIPQDVVVSIVSSNPLMASVEPMKDRRGAYSLAIERAFLMRLDDDEVRTVLAHELGHVWIYTHHPYLQTEQLANKIAMRKVTREQLEQVYGKVWGSGEFQGSLASFLGIASDSTAVGLAPKAEPVKTAP